MPGIISTHWSGSEPIRENAYHLEFAQKNTPVAQPLLDAARKAVHANEVPWNSVFSEFSVWKNTNFDTAMSYGCFMWNHDFRDGSPNIEIAAMCMGGPHVGTKYWGQWPYTKAHAWMHAYLIAVVAHIKGINVLESFPPVPGYMNGPIFAVSTHGERAYQTENPGIDTEARGYGLWSQDPDCRWDQDVLDESDIPLLANYASARTAATISAAWLRAKAAEIQKLPDFADHWNLSQSV